ncbi:MAG: family 78 glycoside hydrolase catalytic domain [Planctomycetes bacterium]|nr:family 78 glycoside hydrolase catalytic domain [Planctomycetota bacterium]
MMRTPPLRIRVASALIAAAVPALGAIEPIDLRCEGLSDPIGIDGSRPRLSWIVESRERAQVQNGYHILAATSPEKLAPGEADLWDTGRVESDRSVLVPYGGSPLASGRRIHWKLRVWDKDDAMSRWSEPAWFEMGLLEPDDWRAVWIARARPPRIREEAFYEDDPAPLFRKTFRIEKPVARARIYISGLGYYELRLNGERVGDRLLDPAWTSYAKRVLYSTYDVTERLREGENAIGAMLGNGWYDPLPLRMWGWLNLRDHLAIGTPRMIAMLAIEFADGTRRTIGTDESWRTTGGPMIRNSVYLGEVFDARREPAGWDEPGFDDGEWEGAALAKEPVGPLRAQMLPPIRMKERLVPKAITEPKPGVFIFDLGENIAGWAWIRVRGPAGTRVTLRYGELLHPDGTLNGMTAVCGQIKGNGAKNSPGAPATAFQTDAYILRGGTEETWMPRFTFHGFRYVEVTGFPGRPDRESLRGIVVRSDIETIGRFACSNPLFNRIDAMVRRTFFGNIFGVQSDCPHREKFGYGGDIAATSEAALLLFDMGTFYAKAVRDLADAARADGGLTETAPFVGIADQGLGGKSGPIGWGTAHPLLIRQLYRYCGDRELLEEQFETARRWVDFIASKVPDRIVAKGIGDHESLAAKQVPLTSTAFFHLNSRLVADAARILGRSDDAERYTALAEDIRRAFNEKFLAKGTGRFGTATQADQAIALALDLAPPEEREAALRVLAGDIAAHQNHVTTGIFGTKYMLQALADAGRADLAATMVGQKTFPGWGHMLERGATTLWEHWEGSDNTFSNNHPMFGSVSEWMMKSLAGIAPDPEARGFDKIVIRPQIAGDLTWARGTYRSVRGEVRSAWKIEGDRLALDIEIPANATATVHIPGGDPAKVKEGGKPASDADGVTLLRSDPRAAVYRVGSGRYRFEVSGYER